MLSATDIELTEDEVRLLTIAARLLGIVEAYAERAPLSQSDQAYWDSRLGKELVRPPSFVNVYNGLNACLARCY